MLFVLFTNILLQGFRNKDAEIAGQICYRDTETKQKKRERHGTRATRTIGDSPIVAHTFAMCAAISCCLVVVLCGL